MPAFAKKLSKNVPRTILTRGSLPTLSATAMRIEQLEWSRCDLSQFPRGPRQARPPFDFAFRGRRNAALRMTQKSGLTQQISKALHLQQVPVRGRQGRRLQRVRQDTAAPASRRLA